MDIQHISAPAAGKAAGKGHPRTRARWPWAWAVALSILAPSAQAASFPCERAASQAERAICRSSELSNLDEYLGRYYAAARSGLPHAQPCITADQREWLRSVRDACQDTACLQRVYLERLAVLHALQPGASRLRHIDLPRVPPLVWVIAPAQDQVAAPRNRPSVAHRAQGKIVNDVAGGDGFVLHSSSGERQLILPLMFLEPGSTDALDALARVPQATYEVRGRADAAERPPRAFSSGHCAFVYRSTP